MVLIGWSKLRWEYRITCGLGQVSVIISCIGNVTDGMSVCYVCMYIHTLQFEHSVFCMHVHGKNTTC